MHAGQFAIVRFSYVNIKTLTLTDECASVCSHLDNILRNVVCPRLRPRSRRICHYGIDFSLLRRLRHGGRDGRNRLRRNCLIKPGEIWNKSHQEIAFIYVCVHFKRLFFTDLQWP